MDTKLETLTKQMNVMIAKLDNGQPAQQQHQTPVQSTPSNGYQQNVQNTQAGPAVKHSNVYVISAAHQDTLQGFVHSVRL